MTTKGGVFARNVVTKQSPKRRDCFPFTAFRVNDKKGGVFQPRPGNVRDWKVPPIVRLKRIKKPEGENNSSGFFIVVILS
jgi:hypothetical protein